MTSRLNPWEFNALWKPLLREDQDQGDNYHEQRQRRGVTAESQPAFRDWLIDEIADDSSEENRGSGCKS